MSCQQEDPIVYSPQQRSVEDVETLVSALSARADWLLSSRTQNVEIETRLTGSGSIPYYLANYTIGAADERWVIVAADMRLPKALAWGTSENSLESMTSLDGVSDWDKRIVFVHDSLQSISTEFIYVSNEPDSIIARVIIPCPDAPSDPTEPSVESPCDRGGSYGNNPNAECVASHFIHGTLLRTTWGQSCSFNLRTPQISCRGLCQETNALTGCVATAGAQIARYHAKPFTPYNIPAYNMQFSQMLDNYNRTTNTIAIAESNGNVGYLMQLFGSYTNMNYGCGSSGTQTRKLRDAFQVLGYQSRGTYRDYKFSLLAHDVENGFPVILRGRDDDSGHAWVCDAWGDVRFSDCSSQTQLHMNWGWNGESDGWYVHNSWNGQFSNGGLFSFNISKKMIHDIRP